MDRPSLRPPAGLDPLLWSRLVSEAEHRTRQSEPAHDFLHVTRVVEHARVLARAEGGDEAICLVAALLHEVFTYPKDHPSAAMAGDVCAEVAAELLQREGATAELVENATRAIRDHAFSKGVVPSSVEGKILQDADRLDALGAIGLARMWATCAEMKRPFYSTEDPFCRVRAPDDKAWGLDLVFKKLLRLEERLHTETARSMARGRSDFLRLYLRELERELGLPSAP
jgi:uncharacterized protein